MTAPKAIKLVEVGEGYDGIPPEEFAVVGGVPAGDVSVAWGDVSGKPSTFPPATHTHAIADVTGLQAILDDYETRLAALETP